MTSWTGSNTAWGSYSCAGCPFTTGSARTRPQVSAPIVARPAPGCAAGFLSEDASAGTRSVPFTRELWIEEDDFRESPPKGYHRLYPGNEVRLRYGYIVKCHNVVKDPSTGEILEVQCTYDPDTRSGQHTRKVKSTIHWVPVKQAIPIEVRVYEKLFTVENPNDVPADGDFKMYLNPKSLEVIQAKAEPWLAKAKPGERYQFERLGYFCVDERGTADRLVFNRTVELRDAWAKLQKKV
jgi:glutaminyl-tRNA synthetase